MNLDKALASMRHYRQQWRTWWKEPHFLGKCAVIGGMLYALGAVIDAPDDPLGTIGCLLGLGIIVTLPRQPNWAIPAGLAWCFASSFQYFQNQMQLCGIVAIVVMFLASGYAMPMWFAVGAPLVYALLDAAGGMWLGTHGAGTEILRALLDFYADSGRSVADYSHYAVAFGVANIVFDAMFFGFYTILGLSFRSSNAKGERLARTEAMLGRVTREQELAHMIHDSVANDVSTIAMLAWQAKSVQDTGKRNAMLDTIYACSHDALDRVHEVIDVLNGKRSLRQSEAIDGDCTGALLDARVEQYVETRDRVMGMLGLHGSTHIEGATSLQTVVSAANSSIIMGLLAEIYANIVRHCAHLDEQAEQEYGQGHEKDTAPAYTLMISFEPQAVRIVQTNSIASQPHALESAAHGKGLSLHRAAIESVGGTITASGRNGIWTLSARIPLA